MILNRFRFNRRTYNCYWNLNTTDMNYQAIIWWQLNIVTNTTADLKKLNSFLKILIADFNQIFSQISELEYRYSLNLSSNSFKWRKWYSIELKTENTEFSTFDLFH